jgi:CheY-like chemotaxis protein
VDRLLERCRERAPAAGSDLDVLAAYEGMVLELARGRGAPLDGRGGHDPGPREPAGAGGVTILVADDDPSIVRLLETSLAPDGFRVLTAADGDAALRLARAHRPDLILLDWTMPGREGVDVARLLRADPEPYFRDVPVVLLTARDELESTTEGFAAGVTDYLTKPFKIAHLRTRVRAWLLRAGRGPLPPG